MFPKGFRAIIPHDKRGTEHEIDDRRSSRLGGHHRRCGAASAGKGYIELYVSNPTPYFVTVSITDAYKRHTYSRECIQPNRNTPTIIVGWSMGAWNSVGGGVYVKKEYSEKGCGQQNIVDTGWGNLVKPDGNGDIRIAL